MSVSVRFSLQRSFLGLGVKHQALPINPTLTAPGAAAGPSYVMDVVAMVTIWSLDAWIDSWKAGLVVGEFRIPSLGTLVGEYRAMERDTVAGPEMLVTQAEGWRILLLCL